MFLREGYGSLFVYCRDALGLSEWAVGAARGACACFSFAGSDACFRCGRSDIDSPGLSIAG